MKTWEDFKKLLKEENLEKGFKDYKISFLNGLGVIRVEENLVWAKSYFVSLKMSNFSFVENGLTIEEAFKNLFYKIKNFFTNLSLNYIRDFFNLKTGTYNVYTLDCFNKPKLVINPNLDNIEKFKKFSTIINYDKKTSVTKTFVFSNLHNDFSFKLFLLCLFEREIAANDIKPKSICVYHGISLFYLDLC